MSNKCVWCTCIACRSSTITERLGQVPSRPREPERYEEVRVPFEEVRLQLFMALAQQPDLMEAARKAGREKKLWVHYRIESTPLDLLERTRGSERPRED